MARVAPVQAECARLEDEFLRAARDLYRLQVTLPKLGKNSGWFECGYYVDALLSVIYDDSVPRRSKVQRTLVRLAEAGFTGKRVPDATTVRRHLADLCPN